MEEEKELISRLKPMIVDVFRKDRAWNGVKSRTHLGKYEVPGGKSIIVWVKETFGMGSYDLETKDSVITVTTRP